MSTVTLTGALFCLGLFGVLTRKDIIGILASVELMLGAANIQVVAYATTVSGATQTGQVFGLAILVLAAAEAAIGLAILIALVRRSGRSRVDELLEVDG